MTTDLILGTAGHIDHGKTSLIRVLTGVDTDRLPEEKKRGITIDLGFAELCVGAYRLGIVDVPGHERFVRNMLAGATGMDIALLVVAADDSIKPQTREHLDILRLLDLRCGVIAITKCDLAEPDWIELVEEEIRDLVAGSFLEQAPIVRTSAASGDGHRFAARRIGAGGPAARRRRGPETRNRLPSAWPLIAPLRSPDMEPWSPAASAVDRCNWVTSWRSNRAACSVRVRGLQNHDRTTTQVHRGQRAAINLAGIHHERIDRGQELATPGHLRPSRLLTARLRAVDSLARPIKNRSRVRVHVGTAEILATVVLLDTDQVAAGQPALCQLFLASAAVTTWNQPFVLRSESPVQTVGGGQVLVPESDRLARHDADVLQKLVDLTSDQPLVRASAALVLCRAAQLATGRSCSHGGCRRDKFGRRGNARSGSPGGGSSFAHPHAQFSSRMSGAALPAHCHDAREIAPSQPAANRHRSKPDPARIRLPGCVRDRAGSVHNASGRTDSDHSPGDRLDRDTGPSSRRTNTSCWPSWSKIIERPGSRHRRSRRCSSRPRRTRTRCHNSSRWPQPTATWSGSPTTTTCIATSIVSARRR